jgi:hypothetical protein
VGNLLLLHLIMSTAAKQEITILSQLENVEVCRLSFKTKFRSCVKEPAKIYSNHTKTAVKFLLQKRMQMPRMIPSDGQSNGKLNL